MSWLSRQISRILPRRLTARGRHRRFSSIQAANAGGGATPWAGTADDNFNQEYMEALSQVQRRSQDLDANNPDVHGWNRTRTAQLVGKGVFFKAAAHADEVSISPEQCTKVCAQIDRIKRLHSRMGGYDSTGHGYTEGKQQERAVLTMFINGRCLIHRVWKPNPHMPLPLSLELIPGSRISTPFIKRGDPRVSFGIEYADEHRSEIVGYWVRRVSTSMGDSFVPDYTWDFVPCEDAVLLSLTEMAGMDQALPACLSVIRMLRNRGEMIEQTVECARAQSKYYAVTQAAPGIDPYNLAADDRDQSSSTANADPSIGSSSADPAGFQNMGGVQMLYSANGEVVSWNNAKLPDPDFKGFMDVTDVRLARGLVTAKSRFTREVNSSWAGGRMEDQQDDPIIDQLRESFLSAWQRVHEWTVEACWLTEKVFMPNYTTATRALWTEYRAEFPGKLHINPVDIGKARQLAYELRTLTPQQACEEDGKDLAVNLAQWAQAMVMVRDVEKEYGLEAGSLDFLLEGKTSEASGGEELPAPGDDAPKKKPMDAKNRIRSYLAAKGRATADV